MHSIRRLIGVSLALAILAVAPAVAEHHEGVSDPFMSDLIKNIQSTEKKMVALADAMPADMFSWAPSIEVRTFSETYIHVAATNLFLPPALGAAPAGGMEMPEDVFGTMQKMEAEITAKDDVIAKLKESFAYLYQALPTIGDLDAEVSLFGPPSSKRSYALIIQGHAHEHLGQAIAYARSVGVVPPWSRPPANEEEDDGGEG